MAERLPISEEALHEFCERWKISKLELFGSILREDFSENSDIDLLVTWIEGETPSAFSHVDMEDELASLAGRRVDLISRRAVEESRNQYRRDAILESTRVLYAAA